MPLQRRVCRRAEATGRSSVQESRDGLQFCLMGGEGGTMNVQGRVQQDRIKLTSCLKIYVEIW